MKPWLLKNNQRGTVFLTTMICVFLMTLTGGYLYKMSAYNSNFANRLQKSTQAQMLAEAGLSRALSTIRASWSAASNASNFPLTTLGPGTYDASVSTVSGRTLVSSVGTVQSVQRTVTAEIVQPSVDALNYAFAGGGTGSHILDVGTGGSAGTITGDIYGAGNFNLDGPSSGGTLAITGSVYASQTVDTGTNTTVSGTTNSNWTTTVNFPTVDFNYYKTIAQANGQYFDSKTYADGTLPANPPGGVIFINGDLSLVGTQTTTATLIATGNITMAKSGSTYPRITVNQYSNYPAMMTQNGEITFTSTGNGGAYWVTTGLVYAGTNIHITGGNHDTFTFTGSILSRGEIQIDLQAQNALTATYVAQNPPGITTSGSSSSLIRSYNV